MDSITINSDTARRIANDMLTAAEEADDHQMHQCVSSTILDFPIKIFVAPVPAPVKSLKTVAPFTEDQVNSLNDFQHVGYYHPVTCGNNCRANLIARKDGWHCPTCDYTQSWAHGYMANWYWKTEYEEAINYPRAKDPWVCPENE